MSDFRYKVSVVIPVYNCGEYLDGCIKSLMRQTMDENDFQIVFVNDGSTDNGGEICERAAKEHSNIVCFQKENGGVSSARNKGIELSEGKYILFLDADDALTDNTLVSVYEFFEEHYDETDLVTYKIVPYRNGKSQKLHFRYRILEESGVYDLNEGNNCYITQTTMNICVKNKKDGSNILFDTNLKFHEDQKYIFTVLKEKMTIGYVSGPEYCYIRHDGAATSSISNAYYIFENTMEMWETFFNMYPDKVPPYLQAFYLHDLTWKSCHDLLLPYYYSEKEFERAVERIISLIKRLDDGVILNKPDTDIYHKHYLLKLKGGKNVSLKHCKDGIKLVFKGDNVVYEAEKITAVINRFRTDKNILSVDAFLKSPVFIYCGKPELYLIKDGKREKLNLTHSEHEHYYAAIKTAVFWRFGFDIDINETEEFKLEAVIDGNPYDLIYYYNHQSPLQTGKRINAFLNDGVCFKEHDGVFTVSSKRKDNGITARLALAADNLIYHFWQNPRVVANRAFGQLAKLKKERIWIYLDRRGVYDNAYDQFRHDIKIKDGVKRYYILNVDDWDTLEKRFEPDERANIVRFGSNRHKQLYFVSEKIITSFSNLTNISPFGAAPMRRYSDIARYELIYLQHGVLHASLKDMYAKERCIIDKVVVSSDFEVKNFTENYGYRECDLIKSGMPRYDFMEIGGEKKNRIIFSPSWRGNLIGTLVNGTREERREAFLASDFYKEISALLNSERLHKILEENNLYLDFRNHPIFRCYDKYFNVKNSRIRLDGFDTGMDEYCLMITDYSSIVFDAVYLNCPVIYFVPDYDKFRAGVSHGYRKLDLPMEEGFGPLTQTADELLCQLEIFIENGFAVREPYRSRTDGFFFYKDKNCRDRIYQAIK